MAMRKARMQADPMDQFARWLEEAQTHERHLPHAMTLSTADRQGRPSARIVLLRGWDANGFVFHTNYESAKGQALATNPYAALVFYWPAQRRQVRVSGPVARLEASESDAYFASRPRGSQIAAWASPQSQVLPDKETLAEFVQQASQSFPQGEVPRPAHWGGYRLNPQEMEFWVDQPDRLHDRIRYRRDPTGVWIMERLAP